MEQMIHNCICKYLVPIFDKIHENCVLYLQSDYMPISSFWVWQKSTFKLTLPILIFIIFLGTILIKIP